MGTSTRIQRHAADWFPCPQGVRSRTRGKPNSGPLAANDGHRSGIGKPVALVSVAFVTLLMSSNPGSRGCTLAGSVQWVLVICDTDPRNMRYVIDSLGEPIEASRRTQPKGCVVIGVEWVRIIRLKMSPILGNLKCTSL